MKRELAEFWAEYKDEYKFYFFATLVVAVCIVTVVFWCTLPIVLCLVLKTGWWLLLYLLIMPGLFAGTITLQDRLA